MYYLALGQRNTKPKVTQLDQAPRVDQKVVWFDVAFLFYLF